jgi:hypothetical protein
MMSMYENLTALEQDALRYVYLSMSINNIAIEMNIPIGRVKRTFDSSTKKMGIPDIHQAALEFMNFCNFSSDPAGEDNSDEIGAICSLSNIDCVDDILLYTEKAQSELEQGITKVHPTALGLTYLARQRVLNISTKLAKITISYPAPRYIAELTRVREEIEVAGSFLKNVSNSLPNSAVYLSAKSVTFQLNDLGAQLDEAISDSIEDIDIC